MAKRSGEFIRAIRAKQPPHWLTFWGTPGTGKTFLARQIHGMCRGAHWLDWVDLCRRYQSRDDTSNRIRWACDARILILDDIGAEHQTVGTIGLLHGLLQSRLNRWTVITSNLAPDDWETRDARISSRIIRGANVHVDCRTTDFALRPKPDPI